MKTKHYFPLSLLPLTLTVRISSSKIKRIFHFCLFPFVFCLFALCSVPRALCQVPQGFNYQAIARDASGNPIAGATIKVKLSILSDTSGFYFDTGGTYIWEEEHTGVKTNDIGLFTVVMGSPSAVKVQGIANSFSEIDWSQPNLFIGTKIANPTNYVVMGSAKLWSVPYSMVSENLAGPVSKLAVTGETSNMEESLFEVINKTGQTVFAVYNEGVRIYVDDGDAKGAKGGFAIGSFGIDKGTSDPLFVVNADSIRAYIKQNPAKGVKGGFAIGSFDPTKTYNYEEYLQVTRDSTRIYLNSKETKATKGGFAIGSFDNSKNATNKYLLVSPDSVRIYLDDNAGGGKAVKGGFAIGTFDPSKGTGQKYLVVNPDSVRVYIDDEATKAVKGGFAIGSFDASKAGKSTFFDVSPNTSDIILSENRVLWYPIKNAFLAGRVHIGTPDSVGENSFASGYESRASGMFSQAMGYKAIADGNYSTAIGNAARAGKKNSFAFGQWADARNEESYAFGRGAIAEGFRSFAFGSAAVDSAGQVTGVAYAKGDYSFAIGQGSQALGKGAFALGLADTAKGDYSLALGYKTLARGNYSSVAIGWLTRAIGSNSTAIGYNSEASGVASFAAGSACSALGQDAIAIGSGAYARGNYAVSIGFKTENYAGGGTALGWHTSLATSADFSLAAGYYSVATGNTSVSIGHRTYSMADLSTAMGSYTTAQSYNSFVIGRYNVISGTTNTWLNTEPLFIIGNGENSSARSNAVTVLKNGNVGIGSLAPTSKLEVNLANSSGWSGNLNALRVYAPDNAYYLDMNTSIISTGNTGYHFNPNGNTGLTISTPGNVGIGTSNPSQRLHVNGDIRLEGGGIEDLSGGVGVGFTSTGWYSDVNNLAARIPGASGDFYIQTASGASTYLRVGSAVGGMELYVGKAVFDNAVGIATSSVGTYKLYVNGTAYSTGGWSGSDLRWKKNIVPLNNILSGIQQLIPVSYEWRRDEYSEINFDEGRQIGLIAQEVEKIFPELVKTNDNGYKAVSYEKLSVVLLAGIKEQQLQIESQQQQIDEQSRKIDQLLNMISDMEGKIASLRQH